MSLMKKFKDAVAAANVTEEVAEAPEEMDAAMFTAMRGVQEGGRWRSNSSTVEIEEEVHRIYWEVMRGLRRLDDYRIQVERWKTAGTKH